MKDNTQFNDVQLTARKNALIGARTHLLSYPGGDANYTVNHAVIKSLDREIEEITGILNQRAKK